MPAVSVIIPVYNVAPYIADCIESLKRQRLEDLEFIFIDDCSTDDSMAFVEKFAEEDPRVCILRNGENIGLGRTKNRGIDAAGGDYISVVDPDDRIAPDFYEKLYAKAVSGNFDIVKGSRVKVRLASGKKSPENVNGKIRNCLRSGIPLFLCFTYQHQTAIYKKSLFADKTVRFGNSRNGEDTTFLLIVCKKTENIGFADPAVYYYSVRLGSLTSSFSEQRCRNELDAHREITDHLLGTGTDPETLQYLENITAGYVSDICLGISEGSIPREREDELAEVLREQLLRIPDWSRIKKSICEISILTDHRKLIPLGVVRPAGFHYDRVRRWADFLAGHPEIEEKEILTGYLCALFHTVFFYLIEAPGTFFRSRKHFDFIREQIGRLGSPQRGLLKRYWLSALFRILQKLLNKVRYGSGNV